MSEVIWILLRNELKKSHTSFQNFRHNSSLPAEIARPLPCWTLTLFSGSGSHNRRCLKLLLGVNYLLQSLHTAPLRVLNSRDKLGERVLDAAEIGATYLPSFVARNRRCVDKLGPYPPTKNQSPLWKKESSSLSLGTAMNSS